MTHIDIWFSAVIGIFILGAVMALVDTVISLMGMPNRRWDTEILSTLIKIFTSFVLLSFLNTFQAFGELMRIRQQPIEEVNTAEIGIVGLAVFIIPYFLGRLLTMLFLDIATYNPGPKHK